MSEKKNLQLSKIDLINLIKMQLKERQAEIWLQCPNPNEKKGIHLKQQLKIYKELVRLEILIWSKNENIKKIIREREE